MYPQTFIAHICSFLVGLSVLTTAKPIFLASVIPTTNERDLIGLLVGENLPEGESTPPNSFGSLLTHTLPSIETSRLQTSSVETGEMSIPIHSFSPTAVSVTTKSSFDTALVVQTVSLALSKDPNSVPSPSSTTGWVGDVSATPPAELTEWKVIGIGVITVTLIAILILSINFFDSWWGFLRSVICGTKPIEGQEMIVPDSESVRNSWEFKFSNQDGHRYPSLSSMESFKKKDFL